MTRVEFMERLKAGLQSLPFSEQEDALRYYEEYFDEAGPENEDRVLSELGSPEEVARNIIANSTFSLQNSPYRENARQAPPKEEPFQPMGPPPKEKPSRSGWWIFLACTAIIWGPIVFALGITLLSVLFALLMVLIALAIAFGAACIAMVVLFFGAVIVGIPLIFTDPLNGLLLISMGIFAAGAGLVLVPLTWATFRYGIPYFTKFCGWIVRKLSGKATASKEELS